MLSRMTYLPPPQQPQQPPQQPPPVVRYGTGVPIPPPAPPKKKNPTWAIVFAVVAALCFGGAAIAGMVNALTDKGDKPSAATNREPERPAAVVDSPAAPIATSPAPPPPPPSPAGPVTSFGTGMYEVGVDIKAGTYTCTATGVLGGYWERAKNASGEFNAIIANEAVESGAKSIVTVKVKEYFKVTSMECAIR